MSEKSLLPQRFHLVLRKGTTTELLEQKHLKVEVICFMNVLENYVIT